MVARTGERSEYVDKATLARSLNAGEQVAAIEDQSNWTWSEDHSRFVVDVGGDLFAAGLDGKAERLTTTPDVEEVGVRFSPDGETVAFIANYNLHVVPSSGGDVRAHLSGRDWGTCHGSRGGVLAMGAQLTVNGSCWVRRGSREGPNMPGLTVAVRPLAGQPPGAAPRA